MSRPRRLPKEAHYYVRRGYDVMGLTVDELSFMFEVSPQRVYQILSGIEHLKVDGKWGFYKIKKGET